VGHNGKLIDLTPETSCNFFAAYTQ
jgi:hypothetical protein